MKLMNALTTGILASSMLFMFTGCSKDDDNRTTNTPTPVVGTMTAKVDGVAWSSMTNRVGGSIMNGVSGINGVANDSTMITVSIQDIIAAGDTIDIGDGSSNGGSFALDPNGSAASGWVSQGHPTCTGTFIVTALDTVAKKMSGTFNFKAFRPLDNTFKNITDGVFTNVTYATTISTSGNSTFTVKIDGTTFTPAAIVGTVALGNLQLTASDNQGSKSVGLTLPETVAPGTYPIGTIGDLYYGSYNPNSSTFTISNSGSVTITSHNTTTNNIVGTFNFVSADFGGGGTSYALTNGAFNITY
ncbi:MAG: hypothetical protein BWY67_01654 [Bacteroidetes bacterium ADurb.Bin397]|jgi:hypothetical protein|nr:MAG: hypothetical protein BWY67_01654 [Bacteroidetes bacterium ADurb.Bin397]